MQAAVRSASVNTPAGAIPELNSDAVTELLPAGPGRIGVGRSISRSDNRSLLSLLVLTASGLSLPRRPNGRLSEGRPAAMVEAKRVAPPEAALTNPDAGFASFTMLEESAMIEARELSSQSAIAFGILPVTLTTTGAEGKDHSKAPLLS